MDTILLTGSTGFLGSYILNLLLRNTDCVIALLVRGDNLNHAKRRIKKTLQTFYKHGIPSSYNKRLRIFCGDQSENMFGLKKQEYVYLKENVSIIYHCAALAEFRATEDKLRKANIEGSKNIFELAKNCRKHVRVSYVSTAFVCGNYNGVFKEDYLDKKQGFNNPYEKSKFKAEQIANKYRKAGLNISIFRPSIVVGEYNTGVTSTFKMFYKPFRSVAIGYLTDIPVRKNAKLNLIPVDTAAEMIFHITQNISLPNNYNIIGPVNYKVTRLMEIACDIVNHKLPNFIRPDRFDFSRLSYVQNAILNEYLCYFSFKTIFSGKNTYSALKTLSYKTPAINDAFIGRLFKYARKNNYIPAYSKTGKV